MKSVSNNHKQSTRDAILHALKNASQLKVEDLAELANVSPVTVRHHLNSLQADGLLNVDSVRRKVGRPYYVYSLSEEGHELFPQKYVHLTNILLDEMKMRLPQQTVDDIFGSAVERIVARHRDKFESLNFEDRLTYLMGILSDEGFLARWELIGSEYHIIEYSCPYLSVSANHSEVCTLDKALIISVMQAPIKQHRCMLNGDECCQFSIDADAVNSIGA